MRNNGSYEHAFSSVLTTSLNVELKTIMDYFASKDAYAQYRYQAIGNNNSRSHIKDTLHAVLNDFHSHDGSSFTIFRISTMNADGATDFFNTEVDSHILAFTGCTYNAALSSIYAIRRKYVRAYSDATGKKQIIFIAHDIASIDKIKTMERALCLQLASVLNEDLDRSKLNNVLNFVDATAMSQDASIFFDRFKELMPADYLQAVEAQRQQQAIEEKKRKLEHLKTVTTTAFTMDYKNEIENTKDELARLKQALMSTYSRLKILQQRQFALDYLDDGTDNTHPFITALLDFLDNHPSAYGFNFERLTENESKLSITVKSYLTPSDSLSDFMRGLSRSGGAESKYEKLIAGIHTGVLKIPVIGTIVIRIKKDEVLKITEVYGTDVYYDMRSNGLTRSQVDKSYAINAHISRYNCFSQGKHAIMDAFHESKYDYIFEAMIEAVGNYNFYDGTVMEVNADNLYATIARDVPALLRDTTGWKQINLGGIDEILNADGQPNGNQPQVPAQETEEADDDLPF